MTQDYTKETDFNQLPMILKYVVGYVLESEWGNWEGYRDTPDTVTFDDVKQDFLLYVENTDMPDGDRLGYFSNFECINVLLESTYYNIMDEDDIVIGNLALQFIPLLQRALLYVEDKRTFVDFINEL